MADIDSTTQDRRHRSVVSAFLPPGYTAEFDGSGEGHSNPSESDSNEPEQGSSLRLQGGDIHRDLYKVEARARLQRRAATFSHPQTDEDLSTTASEQQILGGFRREFIQSRRGRGRYYGRTIPITRNFIEFLDLYGAFAGEELADSDNESMFEESDDDRENEIEAPNESRPLLGKRKKPKTSTQGDAGMMKSFFTLLKAFVGTGIMFLPKAFSNGGILFSSITMLLVATFSMVSFHLLLQCRKQYGGGYGELGKIIGGSKVRALILGSITFSQLGFVCAGMVFVAENLFSFVEAVTKGLSPISTKSLIAVQLIVLIPLSFIRNISKLGGAALLADVFIMIGLAYMYSFDISTVLDRGVSTSVELFNPQHYTLTIGAAIFTFEGIGLILPIQSSMKSPQNFESLLAIVMLIITIIFTSIGALCYATFGAETNTEIISNFPQDDKLVNAVQFLYSLAVLIGTPVQLFPALRIIEGKVFGHRSGKKNAATKWKKNAFRAFLVVFCCAISVLGSNNLDRFVALIGSFACVPLVYIYPPYLHYAGVAQTRLVKAGDLALMGLGLACMVYTTAITIKNSFL